MNLSLGRNFGKRCFFDKNKPINYYVYTAFKAVFGYVEYLGDRPMVGQGRTSRTAAFFTRLWRGSRLYGYVISSKEIK
jgi:hypothetical protein